MKMSNWIIGRILSNLPWAKILMTIADECDKFIINFQDDEDIRCKRAIAVAKTIKSEIDDILYDVPF